MIERAITGSAQHAAAVQRSMALAQLPCARTLACGLLVYSVVGFLFIRHTVAGWSSIMATIVFLGAAKLLVPGIIGEYVGRMLRATRKRPDYIVAETEENVKR